MRWWPFNKAETKESATGPVLAMNVLGRPVWTPRDYTSFAKEAYVQNAVSYACIKLIASNAASAKWILSRTGDEIEDHPLLELLRRPNPMSGQSAFFEAVFAYLLLAGNSYLEAVGTKGKPPRELWIPRPDRMQVIPGNYGTPAAYRYSHAGREIEWRVDPLTGKGQILHLKEFHPANDWYGMARTEPAAFGIDRHTAAAEHNKALLDNGARPSGALVFKPVTLGDKTVQAAPQEVIDAASEELKGHTGPRNAGRPMIFGGNVEWVSMGLNQRDMDFGAGKDDAARDICLAYGVPPVLIITGDATYSNMAAAEMQLWEATILPLVRLLRDHLNTWLCPMFGDGLRLEFDEDAISALEPRREIKRNTVIGLLDKGLITLDEAREALQYDPWDAGAVRKVDAGVLTALLAAVDHMGYDPLIRYARSVGLIAPGTSDADAATAMQNLYADELPASDEEESENA